jgi:thiol:disulfide interchange protein DsbD
MRRSAIGLALVLALGVVAAAGVCARAGAATPRVRVELLGERASIVAGETFWVGLHQRIAPGWHTYWMNPGDSGEPARIDWALPAGFTAGDVVWPPPERIAVGPAMSYGYTGEVVLPIPLTAPRDLARGAAVSLRGTASWLVCEKICIPEEAPVALTLPVADGASRPDPRGAALIAAARRAAPVPSPWPASFRATSETVTLEVAARGVVAERIAEVWFYPARWGAVAHAAPQRSRMHAGGLTLETARGPLPEALAGPLEGVLVIAERLDGGTTRQAFSVRAAPFGRADGRAALAGALALALAGGLLLNLMPCVLPVLSVKILALVEHAGGRASVLRRHGLAYTAGVLASFAVVAGALVALRAGGEQLGWGFQLQSPVFVTLLAYVLFALALGLSGALVIGGRVTGVGRGLAGRAGAVGSFFTGALATVAATPCTAPFMGAAVGWAVTQPWTTSLLVFEALGLGLALPFLALTLAPAWRRWLPRPGPWMERLQQLLAFPLYASVAWLVWVVSQQSGPPGVAAVLAGLVLVALAAWLHRTTRLARARWRRAATAGAVALVTGAIAVGALAGSSTSPGAMRARAETGGVWEAFSPERLATLRTAGTPVFVNVTAAWCLTCLVNERVALTAPAVTEAFARKGVVRLKADWTRRDPTITRVLGSFGRGGVPLYVLYPGSGEPTVLPQILTEGILIQATENI